MRATIRLLFTLLIAATMLCAEMVQSWAKEFQEYEVKAAYIVNFTKYVSWPGELDTKLLHGVNVCIVGDNAFGEYTKTIKAGSVPTLSLNPVVLASWKSALSNCHIAFISKSESAHVGEILSALSLLPVLTVSDMDEFVEKGGHVGFVIDNSRIKLDINNSAATRAGLKLDAQLLEVARKVIR